LDEKNVQITKVIFTFEFSGPFSTKSLLKKLRKAITVTHICQLFADKSWKKLLSKGSQNFDGQLKIAFSVTVTKCDTWGMLTYIFRKMN
jgi:hypothetical protein